MLKIVGPPRRVCNGLTRRDLIRVAGAGLLGSSLGKLLAAEEAGTVLRPRAKNVLFLYLFGGPSQLETFDMKPDAPDGIRGPFKAIQSRTPGLVMCEHLPKLAAMSDKYAVIRTITHPYNDHNACHLMQTGRPLPPAERGAAMVNATDKDWPAMGSVVEYLDRRADANRPPAERRQIPSYVYLPNPLGHIQGYDRSGQYAGWLGRTYDALATKIAKRNETDNPYFRDCDDAELDFRIAGVDARADVTLERLSGRDTLLAQFDAARRELDHAPAVREFNRMRERAMTLVSGEKMRAAFDIRQETTATRDRYGRHLFGQSALMGRRMIEAGARFVTVLWDAPDGYSWDSHQNSDDMRKYLLPGLDQTFSALLEDMSARGLLDETLIVCVGEMGRSPQATPAWGRSHWSFCFPAVLAGAGIRGGALLGRSDKQAAYPLDRPVTPQDLSATIFHALGIPPETRIHDPLGRPIPVVEDGHTLAELFA